MKKVYAILLQVRMKKSFCLQRVVLRHPEKAISIFFTKKSWGIPQHSCSILPNSELIVPNDKDIEFLYITIRGGGISRCLTFQQGKKH